MSQNPRAALVIGASRGLGLGLAKGYLDQGWRVIATRRGAAPGLEALAANAGARLTIETLDVTDQAAIAALRERLAGQTLDLLFVSAGVSLSKSQKAADVPADVFAKEMLTNALSPLRIIESFVSLVPETGTIAVMSSVLGSVSANTAGGYDVYRASKAALNTMVRSFAARNPKRAAVLLHPGWVRTGMGGAQAAIDVEASVAGMIDVIGSRAGKAGCVYLDYQGKRIEW